jgi:hypothetical protein
MLSNLVRNEIMKKNVQGVKELVTTKPLCVNVPPEWDRSLSWLLHSTDDSNSNDRIGDEDATETPELSLLHYAILTPHAKRFERLASFRKIIDIVLFLLKQGANPTAQAKYLTVENYLTGGPIPLTGLNPCKALIGIRAVWYLDKDTVALYRSLKLALKDAEQTWRKRDHGKMVEIPQGVPQIWKKMRTLHSGDTITFQCQDYVDVIAHPALLSASSPYFERFFASPWTGVDNNRCWKTAHTSVIINILLDFIHTGEVDEELCRQHDVVLYQTVMEFEMGSMKTLVRDNVFQCFSPDNIKDRYSLAKLHDDEVLVNACRDYMAVCFSLGNIKDRLQFAQLQGDDALKCKCFDFVNAHFRTIMLDLNFVALSSEDPDLWVDMCRHYLRDAGTSNQAYDGETSDSEHE